ncbi:MAG TPA: response regulator, partial [Candidatus Eremiobacteraceae bacterium]|nr:response regulator [Candidatus Eremiobacteraceae bacterium]
MQKRALIVDTETETCNLIEKVLTSVGIDSLTLNRSSEAPEILREGKFAVAFFAVRMTSPDGPELTRQMRDSTFNRMTPVVLISDDQRPTAVSQEFEAGASFSLQTDRQREAAAAGARDAGFDRAGAAAHATHPGEVARV